MHSGGPLGTFSDNALLWLLLLSSSISSFGGDWPQYRGANHDGVSTDRIIKEWTGSATNPVWRVPVPNCLGSLAVSGGRVFTQARRNFGGGPKEVIVALNAANGTELWATNLDNAVYDGGVGLDDGPRSTPAVDGDSVFVSTSYLKLYRLNVTNGTVIWQKDLRAIYGAGTISYQNCASPLIDGGLIYLNTHTNADHLTLMALRTSDGSVAWRSENEGLTHSTPVLTTIHGVRQVIFATQNGNGRPYSLVSLDPQSGNRLWKFTSPYNYGTSLGVSPVVYEDMVFVCGAHSYGMGSVVMQATLTNDVWTTTRLWSTNNPASHWMTPVVDEGFIYGQFGIQQFDVGPTPQLKCIDMRTGAVKWSVNNFGHGGTLLVDNHLVIITERGELVLAQPNTNAYVELGRFLAIPNYFQDTNKCWNTPAVCDGRVYVRSTTFVAAFDLSVPSLKLDPPEPTSVTELRLTIRTITGAPLASNRVAGLEVRASDDPALALSQWLPLPNSLSLTAGVVRIENVDSTATPRKYYIVREPR